MTGRIDQVWQTDESGHKAEAFEPGDRYFHPKTSRIYVIHDIVIDSERGLWLVLYRPESPSSAVGVVSTFAHSVADFLLPGRFVKVET